MPNNEDAIKTFATQEDADNNVSAIQPNESSTAETEDDEPVLDEEDLEDNDLTEDESDEIEWDETEDEDTEEAADETELEDEEKDEVA